MSSTDGQGEAQSTRLVKTLMAGHKAGDFVFDGQRADGTRYAVSPRTRTTREYDAAGMWAWLRGFRLGHDTAGIRPNRRQSRKALAAVREVLVTPSLADACRTAIRAAMEDAGLDMTKLAEVTGRSRKAISDALRYGRSGALSLTMAEQMMAGTGRTWDVRYARVEAFDQPDPGHDGPVVPVDQAPPEPAGVRRIRALTLYHERGLLRWTGPLDPNKAHRAGAFVVERAGVEHHPRADVVLPWLTGLGDAIDPEAAAAIQPVPAGVTPSW